MKYDQNSYKLFLNGVAAEARQSFLEKAVVTSFIRKVNLMRVDFAEDQFGYFCKNCVVITKINITFTSAGLLMNSFLSKGKILRCR